MILLEEGAKVEVYFGLDEGRKLREGVKAQMATQGLIGDTFLLLTLTRKGGQGTAPGHPDRVHHQAGHGPRPWTRWGLWPPRPRSGWSSSRSGWDTILNDIQLVVNKDKMQGLAGQVGFWQEDITKILDEFAGVSKDIRGLVQDADKVVRKADLVVDDTRGVIKSTDKALGGADKLMGEAQDRPGRGSGADPGDPDRSQLPGQDPGPPPGTAGPGDRVRGPQQ